MEIYARQGDLTINKLGQKPSGTFQKGVNLVLAGSQGSEHVVRGTCQYFKEGDDFVFQVQEDTTLTHNSRHQDVPLKAGEIYRVSSLRERGDQFDRRVDD